MRRTLSIALVLGAAGSTAASAQSGVTLYGVIDAPIEYVNKIAQGAPSVVNGQLVQQPGGNRFGMPSGGGLAGGRWGLRGTEDLGGGMSSLFVLESGFAEDSGASLQGRLFGRQAFVGIQNRFGQLTLGRQYSSMFNAFSNFAPLRYAVMYEPVGAMLGGSARSDNTVKYTGSFGSVTAVAHYSFGVGTPTIGVSPLLNGGAGEVPGHAGNNAGWGAGAYYLSNGFGVSVAYDEWNPTMVVGQAGKSRKAGLAASYSIGPGSIMAAYRWGNTDYANHVTLAKENFLWVGGTYQATPAIGLTLAYYYWDISSVRVSPTATATNPAKPWQVAFVSTYSLSKRTDVYLTSAYARNAALNFDTSLTGFGSGYYPTPGQRGMLGVALGVRHRF